MAKRIDPWKSEDIKDYNKLMEEFGMEPMEKVVGRLSKPHLLMKRRIVFGHRDFGRIADCIEKGKKFAMMTGLMPSGKFHLGHKMLADQIIYYQELGAEIFLCVADVEAHNMRKEPLDKLRETAIEQYLLNYIALGLKQKKCDFYFQSDRSVPYYNLFSQLPRRTTLNEFKAIYGSASPAKMVSVLFQIADILHPQLEGYGGRRPVLVPVGADQDPHIRYTRDVAARMKEFDFVPPSSTYHRFMPGLKGGKMSSSDPYSYIALSDSPEEAERKIMKYAFSGGKGSVEEHRKKGGDTSVDVAYQYLYYMFEPDDKKLEKIKKDYESGALLTGELKQILIEKVKKFLKKHQKKRKKARKKVDKFLEK